MNKQGKYLSSAEAGLGKDFILLKRLLEKGNFTHCGKKALCKKELVIIKDPQKECPDCPLFAHFTDHGVYIICLAHDNITYGLLSVSIPKKFIKDREEQELCDAGLKICSLKNNHLAIKS